MLRAEDSRGGFEAKADMLSITGMTLEQFAGLMEGLGYKAEKGEREKVKPVTAVIDARPEADTVIMDAGDMAPAEGAAETPAPADVPEGTADIPDEGQAPVIAEPAETAEVPAQVPAMSETEIEPGTAPDAEVAGPDTEVFYTFTWGRVPAAKRAQTAQGGKPRGKGGQGGKPKGKGKGPRRDGDGGKGQNFSARPPRREKQIDPDNPFAAALMGLKDNK